MTAHTTLKFAGLDVHAPVPEQYRQISSGPDAPGRSFKHAVSNLDAEFSAQERPVAYWDEDLNDWVKTDRHVALVNPALLGRDPDSAMRDPSAPSDACWSIPTHMYDIVNPGAAYQPLIEVLRGLGCDDVFGEARLHRWGGEVHLDLFIPSFTVDLPDATLDDDPLVLGVTTGYDFYGGHKHYAEVIAANPEDGSVMRGLTDPEKRRHAKARGVSSGETADTVADWWESIIDKFDVVSDALFEVIFESKRHIVDLRGVSCEPDQFVASLGVPGYLADATVDRLSMGGHAPKVFSAWRLYRALTQSLTEDYRGKTGGSSMRDLVRLGNDVLNKPAKTEARALNAFADDLDSAQMTLDDERRRDEIRERATSVRESMDEYDSLKARVKAMLREADDDENDTNASTTNQSTATNHVPTTT